MRTSRSTERTASSSSDEAVAAPVRPSALRVRSITKSFPGVVANDDVSLEVARGTVHGLIGENGAGKSTLMSIVAGLYPQDSGEIEVDGRPVAVGGPRAAASLGIGMVHQHFKLVESMSVMENIILGTPAGSGLLRPRLVREKILGLAAKYGLRVDLSVRIRDLPVGLRQRVEILRALYRGAEILILDEPTAVLTPLEADELFVILRSLAAQDKAVVFITHRLREVMAVTDRVTVMRAGRVVGEFQTEACSEDELAELMVGRRVELSAARRVGDRVALDASIEPELEAPGDGGDRTAGGERVLAVRNLRVPGISGTRGVEGVTVNVHAGEIVGIAGVAGNGQLEFEEAIAGLRAARVGVIEYRGRDITRASPRDRRRLGISYIPEDRFARGIDAPSSVEANAIMGAHREPPLAQRGFFRPREIAAYVDGLLNAVGIRVSTRRGRAGALSGGNIQRLVVARETRGTPSILGDGKPGLLIASQPTRGIDVGAIEQIHEHLLGLRAAGAAILLISFDLNEVLALSDRLHVLSSGELSQALDPQVTTETELGRLMGGGPPSMVDNHAQEAPAGEEK
jgi:ABC-type uncharacterized transport system ATPase subunit